MSHDVTFDENQRAWLDYTSSPWGRIRFAVVRRTLALAMAPLGDAPQRILDVGGGEGGDALPLASQGHDVTLLDPSSVMLATARANAEAGGISLRTVEGGLEDVAELGQFDMVLCHFVLQYRPHDPADVGRLVAALRPGGLISVIAMNPVSRVFSRLVREGPGEALAELGRDVEHTVTFQRKVRKVSVDDMQHDLELAGCRVTGRYGGRIANDLLTDDARKHDPEFYDELERLELALCDQEPYLRIGAFWQLVATRL